MSSLEQLKSAVENGTKDCLQQIEHHEDIECFKKYSNLLNEIFSNLSHLSHQEQAEMLACLRDRIIPLSDQDQEKRKLVNQISWEIFNITIPYLSLSLETASVAQEILKGIAKNNPPRETLLLILENFSCLDCEAEETALKEVLGLFNALVIVLSLFERKNLIKFIPDLLRSILRITSNVKYTEENFNLAVIEKVLELCDLLATLIEVDLKTISLKSSPNGPDEKRYYLFNYFILSLFEQFFAFTNFEMASTYFEIYHPKYNIPRRQKPSENVRPVYKKHLEHLLAAAIKGGVSIDNLLIYLDFYDVEAPDDEEAVNSFEVRDFSIPSNSILVYLASILYHQIRELKKPKTQCRITIPSILTPTWLVNKILPMVENSLQNDPLKGSLADKTLFVLLYFTERIEEGTITTEYFNKEVGDSKTTILMLIQAVASFSASSPHAHIRFISFRLLSRIIDLCIDNIKALVLNELLTNCPFETIKTAAIIIIKENVMKSLEKVYDTDAQRKPIGSLFASPFLVQTFFPKILRLPQQKKQKRSIDLTEDEGAFTEHYSFIMQALNFYYLILSKDPDNVTKIWEMEQIQETNKNFLDPLQRAVEKWAQEYKEKINDLQDELKDQVLDQETHFKDNSPKTPMIELEIPMGDDENEDHANKFLTYSEKEEMLQTKLLNMQLALNCIEQIFNVLRKRSKH
ncbi:hypothetical protein G9A89_017711 [Geosiphon pyriformis]|nr:hypothetical protein G9A89_017711 [Geosiphon pyriformis]